MGAVGEPADQPRPEPVVLALVGGPEGAAGERTGHVQRVDDRVRIGCQGEHGRNAQLGGHRRGGHAADVGHPQMQDVDPVSGERAADPPLGGHHRRPGARRVRRLRHQRDGRQHMIGGRVGQGVDRGLDGAAGHRHHPGDARLRRQRVAEPDQHGRDAAVVTGAGAAEFAVQVGMQEELGDNKSGLSINVPDGRTGDVEGRQPGDRAQVTRRRRQPADQCGAVVVGTPVAEGGDCCHP